MKRRGSVSRGGFAPTIGASARDVSYQRRHTIPWYVDTNGAACRGLFSSYIALVFRVNRRRRSSRARSDAFVRVQVQMVFCYTIDRSMSTSRNVASDDFDEIARVRADVEKAIPRQSNDVVSVPASRRRVERDASSNASRRVRAARSYRERGLLFFVLDACGRVRRRAAKRARYPKVRCVFVISVANADSFGAAGVGNARVRSARGARRGEKRATGGQTRATTRCAKNTAGIDFEADTHPPPRRRREWATCPCCWYTRIRRRSLRRGTPWRARCGSARAGCRRSFPVASGRRNARVPDPGLERTLATSTQRAAG